MSRDPSLQHQEQKMNRVHSACGSIPVENLSALIARLEAAEATGIIMESEAVALQNALGLEDSYDTDWKQCCWNALRGSVDAAFGIAEQALPDREIALSQRKPRHLETCAEWWHASLFKIRAGVVFGVGPSTVTAKAATPALALCIATLRAKLDGYAAEGEVNKNPKAQEG